MLKEKVLYNTKLFAQKGMPKLRTLWSEYDDKWFIKPLPPEQRARVGGLPEKALTG